MNEKNTLTVYTGKYICWINLSGIRLTSTEKQILEYLLQGYSITEISRIKHRTIKTVSTQKVCLYKKLNIKNDLTLFRDLMERWEMKIACSLQDEYSILH